MRLFKKRERSKFGEILVEKGLASKQDVEEALRAQKELLEKEHIQKPIGAILSEKGVIDTEDIEKVLAEQRRGESFILKGLIYSIFHSTQPK